MPPLEVSSFEGESRELMVRGLVDLFDDVCSSGESRWVSLEAPSGWGKTRVGKQFYARLAARPQGPRYWPETLSETSREERKVVVPEFGSRDPDSLPKYFWWGMSCWDDGNSKTPALRLGLAQWENHGPFVSIACKRSRRLRDKFFEKLRDEKGALAKESAKEAATQAAKELGIATLPGFGLGVLLTRLTTGAFQTHRADKRLVSGASRPETSETRLVENLVNDMCQLGKAKFPVVMFVEDVHHADDALLEALGALLRRMSRLLVVTTAWPGRIDRIPPLSRLARDLGDRALRVRHLRPAGAPFPAKAGLMELERDACKAIVYEHYPLADPETVALLVDRYRNPGALDVVCDMDGYKEQFGERGDLYISPDDVDNTLPFATDDLYRKYWEQLPKEVQLRYAVAAAITPAAISRDEGAGHHTWSGPVLDDVVDGLNLRAAEQLSSAIEATTDAYGWVTHVDEYLRRWSEIDQHHIATDAGKTVLGQKSTPRERILNKVAEVVLRGASPSAHAARTVIALHAESFITDGTTVAKAIAVALGDLGHDDTAVRERIRLYEHYLRVLADANIDAETDLEVRFNATDAIAASGRHAHAAEAYSDLHARASRVLGADHRLTLRSLYNFAVNLQESGQDHWALDAFQWACSESAAKLGEDDRDTLNARAGLAGAMAIEGRTKEAIEIFEQVLEARVRELGRDHPDTLASRRSLAEALESAGRGKEAIEMFQQVLDKRVRVLGEDHPETLNARIDLAEAMLGTGRLEAIDLLEQVVAERRKLLGDDHPDTWEARDRLAESMLHSGRWDQGVAVFQQVVDDRRNLLGDDHPDTLEARYRLAHNTLGTDRSGARLEQLLEDRVRVLGEDHPDTLTTRYDLGVVWQVTDRLPEALEMFKQVRDGRVRVLGENHPDTLKARHRIAMVLGNMGEIDEAVEQYKQLISDSADVLGEDHFETFELRNWLSDLLKDEGRFNEAVDMSRQELERRTETFGERHPHTLEAHKYLGITLNMAGRYPEGIAIYEQVIDQEAELLSNDHPEVWLSRRVLGHALQEAGRVDEAIELYKRVRDDRIRVLGKDHEDALESIHDIGSALLDAGRAEEAISILEPLLADCMTVLGTDHLTTQQAQGDLAEALRVVSRHDEP